MNKLLSINQIKYKIKSIGYLLKENKNNIKFAIDCGNYEEFEEINKNDKNLKHLFTTHKHEYLKKFILEIIILVV